MDSKEYTFLWFIENYSYCWHKAKETLISPVFKCDGLAGTSWTLHLYPRGHPYVAPGWIFICIFRDDDGPPFTATYEVGIVAEDGSTFSPKKDTDHFSKKDGNGWVVAKMDDVLSKRKADYLPEDILTVRCKLFIEDGKADTAAPICARTRIGIERISFLHVVDGFSALQPNLKKTYNIYSATQPRHVESCVYICDSCEQNVLVEIKSYNFCQILAKCELYLLDSSGKKIKCAEEDNRCDVGRKNIQQLSLSLTKEAILKKKSEYLPDDKLSLLCECVFSTGIEYQKIEGNLNSQTSMFEKLVVSDSPERYSCVLQKVYEDIFLADVILKTKSNSFPAHKVVLCARSPVFKVTMSNDEKNSGFIEVDDLEDKTVGQLLRFLYTDNLDDLQWETATKLYCAANKYQIEKLRLICLSFLNDKLTSRTATELLVLADAYSDNDLKKIIEIFILENDNEVFLSNEWKTLMEKNPLLAVNTMHLMYKPEE